MLDERGIPYRYRDYRQEPLARAEIETVLGRLGVGPRAVLRRNDRAARELGLTGSEPDERLLELMAEHPTLLQRPIGLLGTKARLGRPPERLLELLD